MWRCIGLLLGGVALAVWVAPCQAGKFNPTLSVGDVAPTWKELPGVDGQNHSFDDLADARLVVVIFTCNHCPVARAYEERLIELQSKYQDRGVRFVAINCNNSDADRLPAMADRAKARGYNYPYLHDESQQSAHDYGATVTPEVFVLGADRRIAYMGGIDDSWDKPSAVKRSYLRDALDALLAGSAPETAETRPKGCGIQFD